MLNGTGSHARLIEGIDLLQRAGVSFGALVVLNRANAGAAADLIDFLLDNGITGFKLNPVAYIGAARQNWNAVGLTDADVIRYFQDLLGIISSNGYMLVESNVYAMLEFLVSKQRPTRCLRSDCGAGDTFQAVAASGDIYPCGRATQTPALRMGSVLDVTLESLSAPARSHTLVSQIRARRPYALEGCVHCAYRQLCQAGCSAQALERYGTVRHRTPECTFFKTMYPYLMRWLSFDEAAFASLNRLGYFGEGGRLVNNEVA
jgi:radical SAM protein with 4Fe4S-binding SPASM domain